MPQSATNPTNLLHQIMLCMSGEDCNDLSSADVEEIDDDIEIDSSGIVFAPFPARGGRHSRRSGHSRQMPRNTRERLVKNISKLKTHKNLAKYELNDDDVLVAAYLWLQLTHDRHCGEDWKDLISWCKRDNANLVENLEYIGTLLDRNIVFDQNDDGADHHMDTIALLGGSYLLHNRFRNDLQMINVTDRIEANLKPAWYRQNDMDHDLLTARHALMMLYPELDCENNGSKQRYLRDLMSEFLHPIQARILSAGDDVPLVKYINERQPQEDELLVLLWTYTDHLLCTHTSLVHLANLVCMDYQERMQKEISLSTDPKLRELGLRNNSRNSFHGDFCYLELCSKVLEMVKSEVKDFDDEQPEIGENLYELKATQSFADLILPDADKHLLESAIKRYTLEVGTSLSDWGVVAPMSDTAHKKVKGTCILLYGEPGTGKTFASGAIASALGKKLFAIDASQLRNKYYGESEKVLRRTFATMRKLVENSANPPMFLLNEADQIVHRRSKTESSCSDVENAIQNIFLEELETFPGIIVLTTNLVDNIDDAYFRRFDIKIELHRPDYECRLKLWKLHLPSTIPGSDQIDCEFLARGFDLSGGQISLVVSNACSEAITRKGSAKRLTQADLVRYAQLEDPWGFCQPKRKQVGFCA